MVRERLRGPQINLEPIVQFYGKETIVQHLGPERIIDAVGLKRVIELLGPKQVIQESLFQKSLLVQAPGAALGKVGTVGTLGHFPTHDAPPGRASFG